ncbi:MAG TPA: hypothetical protein VFF73_36340 [Planctomycetota bacterium]|nr:hypothetical protein [Planctomycetota bacterium]
MNGRAAALSACLLAIGLGSAFAEEQDFVLKTGRKIRGELVEDAADVYVVKVEGGTVRLSKSAVSRVEKVVSESQGPFTPTTPDKKPTTTTTPPTDRSVSTPKPTGPALASPEAIATAKRLLEQLADAKRAGSADAKTLEERVAALPLETMVAVLAESDGLSSEAVAATSDRVKRGSPTAVRPLSARAIVTTKNEPSERFCDVVEGMGDDEDGTIERAIDQRIEGARSEPPLGLVRLLKGKLGTGRSVASLVNAIPRVGNAASEALGSACTQIVVKAKDPDALLQPVKALLAKASPRDPPSLQLLALLLYYRKGADVADLVIDAVNRAEQDLDPPAELKTTVNDFLSKGYHVLLAIRTDAAVDRVLRGTKLSQPLDWRITAIRALPDLGVTPAVLRRSQLAEGSRPAQTKDPDSDKKVSGDVMNSIARMLEEKERTDDERRSIVNALQRITGQTIGDDASAWRRYISTH